MDFYVFIYSEGEMDTLRIYIDILTPNSKLDIWLRGGHRIKNMLFGLEVDIELTVYLEPGLFWTQDPGPRPGDLRLGIRTRDAVSHICCYFVIKYS